MFFCPIFHVCISYNLLLIDRERALYKVSNTALKVSKYRAFAGPYLSVFSPNAGKHGLEKTLYLDTFHTVKSGRFMHASHLNQIIPTNIRNVI